MVHFSLQFYFIPYFSKITISFLCEMALILYSIDNFQYHSFHIEMLRNFVIKFK